MTSRERLSATVERHLLDAGRYAVAEGRADSLSAWVNDALARQAEHDRRLKALRQFIQGYEREHGGITDDEIREAPRRTRDRRIRLRRKRRHGRRPGQRAAP